MRRASPTARLDVEFSLAGAAATGDAEHVYEDVARCVGAVRSKDARFDGWFFAAVVTTRIYCGPSCPVVPPKVENMRFYPSAAAAQQAGYRACKRCRPDASPGSPEWNERADLVARVMRLIADGVVDREGVQGLAARRAHRPRCPTRRPRAGPFVDARGPDPSRLLLASLAGVRRAAPLGDR